MTKASFDGGKCSGSACKVVGGGWDFNLTFYGITDECCAHLNDDSNPTACTGQKSFCITAPYVVMLFLLPSEAAQFNGAPRSPHDRMIAAAKDSTKVKSFVV